MTFSLSGKVALVTGARAVSAQGLRLSSRRPVLPS